MLWTVYLERKFPIGLYNMEQKHTGFKAMILVQGEQYIHDILPGMPMLHSLCSCQGDLQMNRSALKHINTCISISMVQAFL